MCQMEAVSTAGVVARGVPMNTLVPPAREWFVGYLPVTNGNTTKLYVDGKDYCQDLYDALQGAKSRVFLTGLHFMADFALVRSGAKDPSKSVAGVIKSLAQRGVKVYLIVNQFWPNELDTGNPIKLLIKSQGGLDEYIIETVRLFRVAAHPNAFLRTSIHPGFLMHSNHQKTCVIDEKVAFLGGIDLTHIDGDRWDTPDHTTSNRSTERTEKYWHDIHMRLEGPAVEFLVDNFHARWNEEDIYSLKDGTRPKTIHIPDDLPWKRETITFDEYFIESTRDTGRTRFTRPPGPASPVYSTTGKPLEEPIVQIVRSMPKGPYVRQKPKWNTSALEHERACKDAYLVGIRAARESIYLENQWIADEHIWEELTKAAARNKANENFRIVLMLPRKPLAAAGLGANQDIAHSPLVDKVVQASRDLRTFGMYCLEKPFPPTGTVEQIYVHSKIMIIDDRWSLIGSANAGGISLEGLRSWGVGSGDYPDTELSAIILDKSFATDFRTRLWKEHLGSDPGADFAAGADAIRQAAIDARSSSRIRFAKAYRDATQSGVSKVGIPYIVDTLRSGAKIVTGPKKDLNEVPLQPSNPSDPGCVFYVEHAHVPRMYKAWYRWSCRDSNDGAWLMRGAGSGRVAHYYGPESGAYIGAKSAAELAKAGTQSGQIHCRVQITPYFGKPDDHSKHYDNFVVKYHCTLKA